MKWVNTDGRISIKSWCENVDENAMEQAASLSNHPALAKHIALMPDTHLGFGVPIGSVIAAKGAILPGAVGVDIGCGMCACKTTLTTDEADTDIIKKIMGLIRKEVPVGFKHHEEAQDWWAFNQAPDIKVVQEQLESAHMQLGTLGGGNHFIELQKDEERSIWIMIHSGSRNFGKQIADAYNKKAVELCRKWFSNIPSKDLAFLPIDTVEAQEYIRCMEFALAFAQKSRGKMMDRSLEAVKEVTGALRKEAIINIHHNFASQENHFGQNPWVHRKGATQAKKGQLGIIPGSMGTPSYIVRGLGNPDSFESCSHGAGRTMGRKEASRRLSIEQCNEDMKDIVFGRWGKDRKGNIDLGEAPRAYKDIDTVIESQTDLVEPVVRLQPLGVIKG